MSSFMLDVPAWQIFATIGFCLCVAEIFIPGFVVLPIGLGFLLASPVAYFSQSLTVQLLALAVAEVVIFFLLVRKFRPDFSKPTIYSNAEGMIGQECEVIEAVSAKKIGYVKLYGDQWQAKTNELAVFKVGERAIITRIAGNKVFIEKLNSYGDSHDL